MIGDLVRSRRKAHGLSQSALALRAGTTQAAISRIERGLVSPTIGTLQALFDSLGEELVLDARRVESEVDRGHIASSLARSPAERLELAISWNELAGEVAAAGARARSG